MGTGEFLGKPDATQGGGVTLQWDSIPYIPEGSSHASSRFMIQRGNGEKLRLGGPIGSSTNLNVQYRKNALSIAVQVG